MARTPKLARWTGALFLLSTLCHMAGFQIVERFAVDGGFQAVGAAIAAGEPTYRLALVLYATSSVANIALGVTLWALFAAGNPVAAGLTFAWRVAAGTLELASWALRFAMLDNRLTPSSLGPVGQEALHQVLRGIANAAFDLGAIVLGLASATGFALMMGARTLPRALAAIGVPGGLLVTVASVWTLTAPASAPAAPMMFAVLLLTQLVAGVWLLARGAPTPGAIRRP